MSLDEIRIATLALHGALTAANRDGDYGEPLVHLLTAINLLGEANGEFRSYPVDPNLTVPELLHLLTLLELELRGLVLTSPTPSVKGMVALPMLSSAINAAIAGHARRRRRDRA